MVVSCYFTKLSYLWAWSPLRLVMYSSVICFKIITTRNTILRGGKVVLCRRFLWNTCLSSVLFIIWFYCMLCNSYWTGKESKWVSLVDYRVRQSSARSNGNSGKKSSTCVRRFGSQFAINTLMLKTSSWQSHYYCSQKDLKESLFDCSFIFFYMMLLMRNIFLDKNDGLKFSKNEILLYNFGVTLN